MAFFAQAFGPVRARGIYRGSSTARVPLFAVCRSRIAFFALYLLVTLPTFLFSPCSQEVASELREAARPGGSVGKGPRNGPRGVGVNRLGCGQFVPEKIEPSLMDVGAGFFVLCGSTGLLLPLSRIATRYQLFSAVVPSGCGVSKGRGEGAWNGRSVRTTVMGREKGVRMWHVFRCCPCRVSYWCRSCLDSTRVGDGAGSFRASPLPHDDVLVLVVCVQWFSHEARAVFGFIVCLWSLEGFRGMNIFVGRIAHSRSSALFFRHSSVVCDRICTPNLGVKSWGCWPVSCP